MAVLQLAQKVFDAGATLKALVRTFHIEFFINRS